MLSMPRIAPDKSTAASPIICRRRLGRELRQLREASSLRLDDVAAVLGVAPSTVSRVETGKAPTRTGYLTVMLNHYHVDDMEERRRLADLARQGQRQGWWTDYRDVLPPAAGTWLGLEDAAASVLSFSVQAIPALLATTAYTAAACQVTWPGLAKTQIRELVTVQLRRRRLLEREDVRVQAVIDEAALRRAICPANVMTAQLEHLLTVADSPSVTVPVAALDGRWPVFRPSYTLLGFPDEEDSVAACYRTATGQLIVRLRDDICWLRIEVFDADPGVPRPRTPAEGDESGFGFVLIEALAARWGVHQAPGGKTVWAELTTGTAAVPDASPL
jgi:transcriptional regulator with XRE-family HTH domain